MGWRTSHGNRKDTQGPVSIEVLPADELNRPNADDMDSRLEEQKRIGRPFVKGNKAARGRKSKLASFGIDYRGVDTKDSEYKNYLAMAETYKRQRVREMRIAHGFVSNGAVALISTASLALAMSRYLYAKVMQVPDLDLLRKASQLANDARQNELAAWELCSRETSAKTRSEANQTPWLTESKTTKRVRVKAEEEPEEAGLLEEAERGKAWSEQVFGK